MPEKFRDFTMHEKAVAGSLLAVSLRGVMQGAVEEGYVNREDLGIVAIAMAEKMRASGAYLQGAQNMGLAKYSAARVERWVLDQLEKPLSEEVIE